MKVKKEVLIILSLVLVVLFSICVAFSFFKTKSYEVVYYVDDYNITESYDKEKRMFTFTIEKDKHFYSFYSFSSYDKKHKRILGINEKKVENEVCILVDTNGIDVNPLCSNETNTIDFRLTSEKMQEEIGYKKEENMKEATSYHNLEIYDSLENTYFIWNYKGFDVVSNEDTTTIDVFSKDQYEIPLSIQLGKYVILANYESEYTFNKFIIIDIEKHTVDQMKVKEEISFDSYFIGGHHESVYLVDKKNKIEYEIVPHKKKMRKVGTKYNKGTVYTENGFESISLTKLSAEELEFYDDNPYRYEIIDNVLYQKIGNHVMQVSEQDVDAIFCTNKDTVVYLVKDTLYSYDLAHGETKVMRNFEWNFNYKNMIFIYNS